MPHGVVNDTSMPQCALVKGVIFKGLTFRNFVFDAWVCMFCCIFCRDWFCGLMDEVLLSVLRCQLTY